MDAFSRNAMMLLFGSTMLLGIGLVGTLGPREALSPGLQDFFSGHAPIILATIGMLGIATVVTLLLKGPASEDKKENEQRADDEEDNRATTSASSSNVVAHDAEEELEQELDDVVSDTTLALIESEVLVRHEEGTMCPPLGPEVPPAALCQALLEHEPTWICAKFRRQMHDKLAIGQQSWKNASKTISSSIRIRGRRDGEAASYRLVILAHIPPDSSLDHTTDVLRLLGTLPGDRFLEVSMVRVPEEADTFASPMNVAGPMATEILLEKAPDAQGPDGGKKA